MRPGERGYYVIYQDISELRQVERKYINFKNRYRTLFHNEDIPMLIIDPYTGGIIDANPAAEHFYGWSKLELTSKKISDINVLSEEEVQAEMEEVRRKRKRRFNFRHKTAEGEIKDVEVYSQPIKFEEKEYLYSIIHDMSLHSLGR